MTDWFKFGTLRTERDGYRRAYEQLNAEVGNLRTERDGYRNAYEQISAELGELRSLLPADRKTSSASQGSDTNDKPPAVRTDKQDRLWAEMAAAMAVDYFYFIDIVGTCNLRCPSCAVGNMPPLPKGLMSVETYKDVLAKIVREHDGEKCFIDLYNWGESVLHPHLAEIISMTSQSGIGVGISTNLNVVPRIKELIKSKPSYIRISLSGSSPDAYNITHRGGDIFAVKANMYLLRHTMNMLKIQIPVQVGYHVYSTNCASEYDEMRKLCEELEFFFIPTLAIILPLEKMLDFASGTTEQADQAIVDRLLVKPHEWRDLLQSDRHKHADCLHRQARTTINFDGSVPLCCVSFTAENVIAKSFLDTPRKELERRKYAHATCDACFASNIDMISTGVRSKELTETINARVARQRSEAISDAAPFC